MEKIKECPFCGSDPYGPNPADDHWWIECEKCEIVMEHFSKSYLIKMWNTRSTISSEPIIEADACKICGGKLSFGLCEDKWVCAKCGANNRTA